MKYPSACGIQAVYILRIFHICLVHHTPHCSHPLSESLDILTSNVGAFAHARISNSVEFR
jgi:hypothetical protein